MDNFEKILVKELIKSLTENPDLWETSIMGLKRDDGLDLNIGLFGSISVYKPYEYEFKDKKLIKILYDVASEVKNLKRQIKDKQEELENKNKLSTFLKLDTRKNKLEHLNEIYEVEKEKEEELKSIEKMMIDSRKTSIFKKIFNLFVKEN